ncbi:MAG: hypothetical protein ABIR32_18260 [Ilumatobacteraceae bacterium]
MSAAPPIEAPERPVGRTTTRLVDPGRDGRVLSIDVWHPAQLAGEPLTSYEPLPSIVFESAVAHDVPAVVPNAAPGSDGKYPLAVVSHGRTGMRIAYSLLCEALAARGFVVVAADHPGDALNDWLGGTFVDDRTNETGRVGDSGFLLDRLLQATPANAAEIGLPIELLDAIDPTRVISIGHSYGAYTGLAATAGVRGVEADSRISAVVGLQPYTRSMSDSALARVKTPTLLVISEFDKTTPTETDGDRPWTLINASPTWRLDLAGAAHHAASDMGLYLELAGQMSDLPMMVNAYVGMMSGEMTGPHMRPWREGLLLQIRAIAAFADVVLDIDPARGAHEADAVAAASGIQLRRR